MTYLPFFLAGLKAYPASAEDCPYRPGSMHALAWLDGIAAGDDRDRWITLAGNSLAYAIDDVDSGTRIAIERYAGRAVMRALEMPGCVVTVIAIPGPIFEPDLCEGIENAREAHTFAGRNYDMIGASPDEDQDEPA